MTKSKLKTELFSLKKKFLNLSTDMQEAVSLSLLKINLGVHREAELETAKTFFGSFPIRLEVGTLESLMEFLHSESESSDGEEALSVLVDRHTDPRLVAAGLPGYNEDDVETLKEPTSLPKGTVS